MREIRATTVSTTKRRMAGHSVAKVGVVEVGSAKVRVGDYRIAKVGLGKFLVAELAFDVLGRVPIVESLSGLNEGSRRKQDERDCTDGSLHDHTSKKRGRPPRGQCIINCACLDIIRLTYEVSFRVCQQSVCRPVEPGLAVA